MTQDWPQRDRFDWQRDVVASTTGQVLNVGCNEDPALLKGTFGPRVINCDIEAVDSHLNRPNNVDVLFDAVQNEWPFPDDSAQMVVFGDILEHLMPEDCLAILKHAHRIAARVAITVPREVRDEIFEQTAPAANPYMFHQVEVTDEYIRERLDTAGWVIDTFETVNYGFVPEGYFITASRKP